MPRPACSVTIDTVEDENSPPEPGEARAYRFRLADSQNPHGSSFQARIEFATAGQTELRSEGKLTVTNLTGLTIKQADTIKKGAWVKVQGGYHDKQPGSDTICFYGQLDDLSYELNRGQLLWRLTATATPGVAYNTKVNARFDGQRTYAQVFEGLLAKAGIVGFNAATIATQHTVTDYSTSGLVLIEEVRDLVLRLRRDARLPDGTEPRIIAAPYVGTAGDDVSSLFLVDVDETFSEVAYTIDLDLVHSAAPEVDSQAIADVDDYAEDDEGEVVAPMTEGTKRFNVVMDFDPNVRNGILTACQSRQHGIQLGLRLDNYIHTIGTGQWQTQLNGEVVVSGNQ